MQQGAAAPAPPTSGMVVRWRGTNLVQVAGRVSSWTDISGSGDTARNAVQATGAIQPAYSASDAAFNGEPTVSFSRARGDMLVTGAWSIAVAQGWTWIVVGKCIAGAADKYFIDSRLAATQYALIGTDAGFYAYCGAASSSGVATTSASVMVARLNGVSTKFNVNTNTAVTPGVSPGANTATGITIGNYAGGGGFCPDGAIAEIIAYSRLLSDAEVLDINAYASARYGVPIS